MTNIYDLTNMLRDVRKTYQQSWREAEETREQELSVLDRDYRKGSPTYEAKRQEIELNHDISIVRAREKAAKKAAEEIEDLKSWELSKVGRIDEATMQKINALRGIPLTARELGQVLDKHGTSNYWVQRAVASLAEENGISASELPIDAPVDVKLSVLDNLSSQLDKLLKYYDAHKPGSEEAYARFLYLNDSLLQNAVTIYTNGVQEISEMDAVTRSYYKTRAMSGQMGKACAISNALRNLKGKDSRNALLYRLATDDTIMSEAYQIAGIADEMAEWKSGKSQRYVTAQKMVDKIKSTQDTERVKEILRNYMERVNAGMEQENEFLKSALMKSHRKNSFIGKSLAELSMEERKMLLDSGTPEEMYQGQDGVTTAEHGR